MPFPFRLSVRTLNTLKGTVGENESSLFCYEVYNTCVCGRFCTDLLELPCVLPKLKADREKKDTHNNIRYNMAFRFMDEITPDTITPPKSPRQNHPCQNHPYPKSPLTKITPAHNHPYPKSPLKNSPLPKITPAQYHPCRWITPTQNHPCKWISSGLKPNLIDAWCAKYILSKYMLSILVKPHST